MEISDTAFSDSTLSILSQNVNRILRLAFVADLHRMLLPSPSSYDKATPSEDDINLFKREALRVDTDNSGEISLNVNAIGYQRLVDDTVWWQDYNKIIIETTCYIIM